MNEGKVPLRKNLVCGGEAGREGGERWKVKGNKYKEKRGRGEIGNQKRRNKMVILSQVWPKRSKRG